MQVIDSYGVTEVLSFVIVAMVAIGGISVIIFWGIPYMDDKKNFVRIDSALTQFDIINDVIQTVAAGGVGGSNMVDFVTDAGQIHVDSVGERFILYYSLDAGFDFNVTGLGDGDDEFNFVFETGSADHVDIYYLNSGYSDLDNPIPGVVDADYPLIDAVQIDIEDNTDNLIGRIWLFDTGSISYKIASGAGFYEVLEENGGVVFNDRGSGHIPQKQSSQPNILYSNSDLVIPVIQLKQKSGVISVTGLMTVNFLIKSNITSTRENRVEIPDNCKIKVFGEDAAVDAWAGYLKSSFGFDDGNDGTEDLLLLNIEDGGQLLFTLLHMVCDITMSV